MISVAEALDHVFGLVSPVGTERVPLRAALGRVLAEPVVAMHDQPPFSSSVMDGYAVRMEGAADSRSFRVIDGEAAAGRAHGGSLAPGEAIRIFTGAPVPPGADRVVIQEDVDIVGDRIQLKENDDQSRYIRDIGADFKVGATIPAPRRLRPSDLSLIAAMNVPELIVRRRPVVALIATGNELVMPGDNPSADQIVASNGFGLAAMAESEGAEARLLPIARDNRESLDAAFALTAGVDLIVTIGGASVGDYDIVGSVAAALGMERAFYKIAMRPGKPLMAGRLAGKPLLGLPGNPVSSMVCGLLFMRPALRAMQGLPAAPIARSSGTLSAPVEANGPREHYMRATLGPDGRLTAAERQDSALLSVLASANALIVRPPRDPARAAGDTVEYIAL